MPWRSISLHVMESPEHQKRSIREYMAGQCRDEEIVHLEKVASERIYGEKHDVWDVHTDKGRWWVITNMTNLYSQSEFKSMDYALSFHIGLCARIGSRQQRAASEDPNARFLQTLRRWETAARAFDKADEAEEFQAVGMACRECLLVLVREARPDRFVP